MPTYPNVCGFRSLLESAGETKSTTFPRPGGEAGTGGLDGKWKEKIGIAAADLEGTLWESEGPRLVLESILLPCWCWSWVNGASSPCISDAGNAASFHLHKKGIFRVHYICALLPKWIFIKAFQESISTQYKVNEYMFSLNFRCRCLHMSIIPEHRLPVHSEFMFHCNQFMFLDRRKRVRQ